jgi:hypothetical protein
MLLSWDMGVTLNKFRKTKNKFFNLHLHIGMIIKRITLLLKMKFFLLCYTLRNFEICGDTIGGLIDFSMDNFEKIKSGSVN